MKYIVIVLLCVFSACKQKTANEVSLLDPVAFGEIITKNEVQLVDVRTPDEWKDGIIGDALKIDFLGSGFAEEIIKLDKNKPIAVYCRSGGRSAKAASILLDLGFNEVYELKGGILNWNEKQKQLK